MLSIKHFVCCGMDVHKKFVVAAIALTDYRGVTSYVKKRFATFNSDLDALKKWLLSTALRSALNPLVNTGFQFLISWRIPVTLSLLTPSMSELSKDRKPMTKTLPELLICLNLIWFLPVISPVRKFVCFGNCSDTGRN